MLNSTLEEIDLSDNDLRDEHSAILCSYIRVRGEARDLELWKHSLRKTEINAKIAEMKEERQSQSPKRLFDQIVERKKSPKRQRAPLCLDQA